MNQIIYYIKRYNQERTLPSNGHTLGSLVQRKIEHIISGKVMANSIDKVLAGS